MNTRWFARLLLAAAVTVIAHVPAFAQLQTATVPTGNNPLAFALNPVTNKIYVANSLSNNVTVIDGATNNTITVPVGNYPNAVAVNPVTNKIYVTNYGATNITVIDGATNATTTVMVGNDPHAVAVNPVTNKIYVANSNSQSVTVIDGISNNTATVTAGAIPWSIAVNPVTNKIYVANLGIPAVLGGVTVIDGATDNTASVSAGTSPVNVVVNASTNKIYVANRDSNNVTVINGVDDSTVNVAVGNAPVQMAVNSVTNQIYVANSGSTFMTIIDGVTNNTITYPIGSAQVSVAVNESINLLLLAVPGEGQISFLDFATDSSSWVGTGQVSSVLVNPVTNLTYAILSGNSVAVLGSGLGSFFSPKTVSVGASPDAVAINPVTNKIYIANNGSNTVTVIDGATNNTATVNVGAAPVAIAVNRITNQIYVANYDSANVTQIDGATDATTTIPTGRGPIAVAVNEVTNQIYVANFIDNTVTEIYGPSGTTTTVATSSSPRGVVVNPVTNKIYVSASANVTVIDGATNNVTNVPVVGQGINGIDINTVTNKIYVVSASGSLTVIDGATNNTTSVPILSGSSWIAVNPVTNKIYVANPFNSSITVVDGATNSSITAAVAGEPAYFAVNTASNQIYFSVQNMSAFGVIDGAGNNAYEFPAGSYPTALAVNPITGRVYVANEYSNNVTVVEPFVSQPSTLTTAITPLPGNRTASASPAFTFTATSSTPAPPNVEFFQVDSWAQTWTAASGSNPTFNGATGPLQPGFHILYAWAGDGREATAVQGSPEIGAIQAYGFLVVPTAAQVISFPPVPPQGVGIPLALGAMLSSGLPVTYSSSTLSVCTVSGYTATFLTAGTCTITASQNGDTTYTAATPVTQSFIVVADKPFVSTQTPGPLRNNYSGFVGFTFTVGATPLQVYSLGRFIISGNGGNHIVKLVQANGTDVAGGSVTVSTSGATAGQYLYAALPTSITLQAATTYFLVSQETSGGDQWYDYGAVGTSSAATVVGPAYSTGTNTYVTAGGLAGDSYVPVNFLYGVSGSNLAVNITSPTAGATLSGNASITASLTGAATSLQLQVDGKNQGNAVPVAQPATYTFSLDTTTLTNGAHTISVTATDAQSNIAISPAVSVNVNNLMGSPMPFVTAQQLGPLRNNYTGFVGMQITVGNAPLLINSLGRFVAPGNVQTHLLELVQTNGTTVPGGSISVSTAGATAGTFQYAVLPSPVTLLAKTTYYLVSAETSGGDQWYDYSPITTAPVATVAGPSYTAPNDFLPITVGGAAGYCYVPLSFQYGGGSAGSISATITAPQSGATISGASVPVTVSTTGNVTSLQLQVDGLNQGSPASASPLILDTTALTNGQHTLTVVASGGGSTAVSPGVSVTVNNGGPATTAFITAETGGYPRNNYSGLVGMQIKVGGTSLSVSQLGRFVIAGNGGAHLLKLVQANGTDVPGGSVTVSLAGAPAGAFLYGALVSPVTLQANTTYFLVSQETSGGDQWYDIGPVTGTNAATVNGPVYTDLQGVYQLVALPNPSQSYVPVNFLYGSATTQPPPTVSIAAPTAGAVSGVITLTASATAAAGLSITGVQFQLNGSSIGPLLTSSPYTTTFNTATLANGSYTLTAVATDSGGNSATSAPVQITVSGGSSATPFLSGPPSASLRNNYSGFVGMEFTTGGTAVTVSQLGRYVVSGNSQSHIVKLVSANGTDVTGGSVTLSLSGAAGGQYAYAPLPGPVTLTANTTYYLLSQEVSGGDQWYDIGAVTGTNAAAVNGPVYTDASGAYILVAEPNHSSSYVPVNFLYNP